MGTFAKKKHSNKDCYWHEGSLNYAPRLFLQGSAAAELGYGSKF